MDEGRGANNNLRTMGLNASAFRFVALLLLPLLLSSTLPGTSGGYGMAAAVDRRWTGETEGEADPEPPLPPMAYPHGDLGGDQDAYIYDQAPNEWPQQQSWNSTMTAVQIHGTAAPTATALLPPPPPLRFSEPGTASSATRNGSSTREPAKKLVLDKTMLPLGDGPERRRPTSPEVRMACERAQPAGRLNRRMRGSCNNLESYIIAPKTASITEAEALMVRQLLYENLMREFKVGGVPLYWLAYLEPEIAREIANMPQVRCPCSRPYCERKRSG